MTNVYSNRLRTGLGLQQPTGAWTNGFAFDITKRLTNVTSSAGALGYLYEAGVFTHQPARITLPNTSYITNVYDADARLTATFLKNSGDIVLDSYSYIYNPANQRTNLTRADASAVAFKYDRIGQLTVADSSVPSEDRGYTYDKAWNLNWLTNNGVADLFQVNSLNELTNCFAFTNWFDANGNMTNTRGSHSLTYDDENRLTLISDDTYRSFHTTFAYDGLGRLRKRTEYTWFGSGPILAPGWRVASSVEYIYDGWRVIQERDGNNVPTVSYTRGNDLSGSMEGAGGIGGLLARSSSYSAGNFTTHNYYFADGNGNITYMLDSSQSMVASYRYDPFGNTISSSGALANVYRFSSKEIHANSGMYYYGYRFYDPNLQRWLNRDPMEDAEISEGANLYLFVGNDALNWIDPDGLKKIRVLNKETGQIREFDDTEGVLTPKEIAGIYGKEWAKTAAAAAGGAALRCEKLFAGGGWLNSNRYLRIGIGRDGGRKVFRIAGDWVGKVKKDPHIVIKDLGPL